MMKEPWFWREKSFAARAVAASLAPGVLLYEAARRVRNASARPAEPTVPVICVGNATLGGVGKTPFALMLEQLLREKGVAAHFLTRGFGGTERGPVRVSSQRAREVGDEALLLAAAAPAWVSRDRPAGAKAAAAAGAEAIILDDGYQNPSLKKTLSFLLVDADDPYGNGRVFPAGPLREPVASAVARADAVVSVVSDKAAAPAPASGGRPQFRAWLEPVLPATGKRVVAFCGVGRPERFFATLAKAGAEIAESRSFADHHPYTEDEIARLKETARAKGAVLMTTAKDFVRIAPELREGIEAFPVRMVADDPAGIAALMLDAIERFGERHD
jgi:tetraacyldisaccharide 4'-kinase